MLVLIRCTLAMAILYFVYKETGWAVTLCFALIAIDCEILSRMLQQVLKRLGERQC